MSIVNTFSLQSNRQIKINFDGGDLSSDAGLLLIKEFVAKIGFTKLIKKKFKTNDKSIRFHKDHENLLQMIYQISYAVTYGEFMYQAGSWKYPRRVVFKIEKPYGQLTHMYTFIVTNMDMEPYQIIQFYCGRGKMKNFIKESKSGFDFAAVSSHSKIVNANRMRLHMLAYNLFNWFRRLVLPASMRKQQVDTIRLKLIKIAARAIHSARSITFKLCSSCPYKKEFYRTLANIHQLFVQLE